MALPSLSKTWDVDPNVAGGVSAGNTEDYQRVLFAVKNAMVGGGNLSMPWTVISSSDSATADASDNWVDFADLISGAGTHSWIVLEDPTGDYQICLDLNNAQQNLMTFIWSPDGTFTGGTTSARPTASGTEHVLFSTANWLGNGLSTHTSKVHVIGSTDGNTTFVVINSGSVTRGFWIFSELENTPTGLTDSTFLHVAFQSTTDHGEDSLVGQLTLNHMDDGGVVFDPRVSCESILSAANPTTFMTQQSGPSVDSLEHPMGAIGIWGEGGGAQRGKKGNIPDMFWGLVVNSTGDQFPDTGTLYQFTQFGDIILPWDSTTAVQVA